MITIKHLKFFVKSFLAFTAILLLSGAIGVSAAIDKHAPGETIVIGEFVYDDEYVATTTDCTISIYNPAGQAVAPTVLMTALPSGWHYYSTSTLYAEGVWPATMTCGSALRGDLANLDKTFLIGYATASTTAISDSVWNNTASSSIASVVNQNTISALDTASSSISSVVNANTSNIVTTASTSLAASLPSLIWNFTGRTLDNISNIVAGVWTYVGGTGRALTSAILGGDSLALQSDVTAGTVAVSSTLTTASTSIGSMVSGVASNVNANTNASILNASTSIGAVVASGNAGVNANTNASILNASTSIASVVNSNTNSQLASAITTINNNTNATVLTASTSLASTIPTNVWGNGNVRSLSTFGSLAADVWNVASSTLTAPGTIGKQLATATGITASEVWSFGTRNLTDANLNAGSLATLANVTTASTSVGSMVSGIATNVNANTNASILNASTSLASAISSLPANIWSYSSRTLTNFGTLAADVWDASTRTLTDLTLPSQSTWIVSTSDFGTITAGSNYLANVTTVYNSTLSDSMNLPTVTIYDPSRNVIVNGAAMTRTAAGTYTYSYSTPGNAPAGTWESVFSATVEAGKTLPGNDYWTVVTSPAQVIINSISDNTVPTVGANITITNEGLSGNEYQYEWCVVSNVNNACGDGDDVFHAVAAKYINAGEDFNTTLTADINTAGNYYFKVIAYFGTDSSGASRSFSAVADNGGGGTGGNGGGGGSGGSGGSGGGGSTPPAPSVSPVPVPGQFKRSDFNRDGRVDSIDFSILLYFWKTNPPFRNIYVDVNKDAKINSVDFSILLYDWDRK